MVDLDYMPMRLGPYLLFSGLLCLLFFILGIKYGTYVEKQNKIIAAMPTMTPPPAATMTPTPVPELTLTTIPANACGISFIYPSFMTLHKLSSAEASLNSKNAIITYTCDIQSPLFNSARDTTLKSTTLLLKGKKINAKMSTKDSIKTYIFTTTNSITGKPIAFLIEVNLFPLVESSLTFSK